jgi:hypothetical protein
MEAKTVRFHCPFFNHQHGKIKGSCCYGIPEDLVTDDDMMAGTGFHFLIQACSDRITVPQVYASHTDK